PPATWPSGSGTGASHHRSGSGPRQCTPTRPAAPMGWVRYRSGLRHRAAGRGSCAMNRTDVEFNAEGTTLRGWLYRPDGDGPVPGVVMAHGFSAVKEMYLDSFAEVFAAAGLAALVFDNRNFGASDGEPRYEIDPWAPGRDSRHAITYLQSMPGIDRDRIGVWGSSY